MAVAIGTAHGFYKQEPKLDLERLEKINEIANATLVLHGGSGVPHGASLRKNQLPNLDPGKWGITLTN